MTASSSFDYIETSVPAGVTIPQYRASRPPRPSRWYRVVAWFAAAS
jgi:hypothetical protein